MSYRRSCQEKRKLRALYSKTKYKYGTGGAYYDLQHNRYIRYQLSTGSRGMMRFFKNQANRRVRHSHCVGKHKLYKREYPLSWILF